MATKTPVDEKFENVDFDLFEALSAMDKKDYGYYDRLTEEQQKKFVPYMMMHWMSAIKSSGGVGAYYLMNTDYTANKYFFNEYVQKHPKLQWLMLCASSPGMGKQFHQWIPHLSSKIAQLKETPKEKDVADYFGKIYPKSNPSDRQELASEFVKTQKKKVYLANKFPHLKIEDIETLSAVVTDQEIARYEKDSGND